jgi:hypothetical protein
MKTLANTDEILVYAEKVAGVWQRLHQTAPANDSWNADLHRLHDKELVQPAFVNIEGLLKSDSDAAAE